MHSLNPNHPVTIATADQWHKFCALLMNKLGQTKVTITMEELTTLMSSTRRNIVCHAHKTTIDLLMVTDEEATALVEEHGGKAV